MSLSIQNELFRMCARKAIVADKKSEFYGIVKKELNVENKNFLNHRETWGNRIAIDQHLKIHFKVIWRQP